MKKFLGIALLSVFVLAACGGGSDSDDRTVVCTVEEAGIEVSVTLEIEGGEVVSMSTEGAGFEMTFDREQLEELGEELDADTVIADAESNGATCN